jgi:hypothetical protein
VIDIMWVIDHFVRATLMMKEEETERLRLVSEVRRQPRQDGKGRSWRWRIEPGMEEAFEHLRGWFLSSQREAAVEAAALAQGAARLEEAASLGGPDQTPLVVGWPVPACCAPRKGYRRRDADLVVTGPAVPCCAP